ncbi:MAG: hypothetical protein M1820_002026 [Bogoriella megaspora]|nr:MAG: hypothetical protein M1820_002026 [Bogoriella megaspora]
MQLTQILAAILPLLAVSSAAALPQVDARTPDIASIPALVPESANTYSTQPAGPIPRSTSNGEGGADSSRSNDEGGAYSSPSNDEGGADGSTSNGQGGTDAYRLEKRAVFPGWRCTPGKGQCVLGTGCWACKDTSGNMGPPICQTEEDANNPSTCNTVAWD